MFFNSWVDLLGDGLSRQSAGDAADDCPGYGAHRSRNCSRCRTSSRATRCSTNSGADRMRARLASNWVFISVTVRNVTFWVIRHGNLLDKGWVFAVGDVRSASQLAKWQMVYLSPAEAKEVRLGRHDVAQKKPGLRLSS
jgi:hypothetical protein